MKILAVIAGPSGVGLFSLLRNLQQTLTTIGSFGGHNAIVQVIPTRQGCQRDQFVASVFWVSIGGATLVATVSIVFADPLAAALLSTEEAYLIRWLAVPTVLGVMLIYFRAMLNAYLEIGAVAWVNIYVGLASVLVVVPAAVGYERLGASALVWLLALPLAVGAGLAVAKARGARCLAGLQSLSYELFEWSALRLFSHLAVPSLLSALVGMASVLLLRSMVIRQHGLTSAGYFDAAWAISAMYLSLFLSAMQTYLVPAMSGDRRGEVARELLDKALHLATMAVVPLITFVIVIKPYALGILYSGDFLPAIDLLRWTLLGDYLRVSAWVLATYLLARADMSAYLVHELIWNLVLVAVGVWFLSAGLSGLGVAYLSAYVIYWLSLLWRVRVRHTVRIYSRVIIEWVAGGCVVLVAGLTTWNAVTLDVRGGAVLIFSIVFSWLIMRPAERRYAQQFLFDRFNFRG